MNRKYFYILISLTACCLLLIFFSMWQEARVSKPQEQIAMHPASPFKTHISGVGIVQPSETVFIGTPVNRIVDRVQVSVGMDVKKGTVLFQLEERDLEADRKARQAAYEIALAKQRKLEDLPRPEDVAAAQAALESAQIEVSQTSSQYEVLQGLQDTRAMSQEEINLRQFKYLQAKAKWQQAQAYFDKVKAGTWKPDLEIARLETMQAKANVERAKVDIERTIIRSPIDGKVLQIKIKEGEFTPPDTSRTPLMIIGNTDEMHLQVSINQFDASSFHSDTPAVAFLRGDARTTFPLEFLRIEPYLVNKQNVTNDITEKVDTRVLQIIYRFKNKVPEIFVGQQMDVFIETTNPHRE